MECYNKQIDWIDCLIDWLKVSGIRNLLKVKWEGIKGLSQTFILLLWSPWIQILFITKPSRENDMTSSIYLNDKGCWKIFEFHLKIFSNSETLCNSMIFTSEDKMTSSNYMKYELGVSKDQIQSPFGNYFLFGVIWVLFKLFFSKIKIYRK